MRPAAFLGGALHPGRLVLESLRRPIGLYIDRFDDAIAGEIVEIFADRIVATDRLVGAEDARLHRLRPAREDRPGARCDDAHRRCRSRGSPLSERKHMGDHRRARSPVDHVVDEAADGDQRLGLRHEAGAGRERRQPAQAPGAPREFGDRVAQRREIAALQPVGQDDDRRRRGRSRRSVARPERPAARRRCGCRRPNRSPDARPPRAPARGA